MSDIETSAAPAVDTGAHAAMPSASAIAADPSLSVADRVSAPPVETYSPTAGPGSVALAVEAIGLPIEVRAQAMTWIDHGNALPQSALDAIDAADMPTAQAQLRELWGTRFDANVAAIKQYLNDRVHPELADVLANGRTPDGRAFANDPAMLQRLLGQALKPAPRVANSVAGQIREIEAFMRQDRTAYNRDAELQARYRELLTMRESKQ